MAEVARRLGVAYPTFRRRFREAMGVSPGRTESVAAWNRRVTAAGKSVKQVADELGYSDPFTFSAQFKAHFGLSPQRFRAR